MSCFFENKSATGYVLMNRVSPVVCSYGNLAAGNSFFMSTELARNKLIFHSVALGVKLLGFFTKFPQNPLKPGLSAILSGRID